MEYDGWINLELLHDMGVDELDVFRFRANITISYSNSGISNVVQDELSSDDIRIIKVNIKFISCVYKYQVLIYSYRTLLSGMDFTG